MLLIRSKLRNPIHGGNSPIRDYSSLISSVLNWYLCLINAYIRYDIGRSPGFAVNSLKTLYYGVSHSLNTPELYQLHARNVFSLYRNAFSLYGRLTFAIWRWILGISRWILAIWRWILAVWRWIPAVWKCVFSQYVEEFSL